MDDVIDAETRYCRQAFISNSEMDEAFRAIETGKPGFSLPNTGRQWRNFAWSNHTLTPITVPVWHIRLNVVEIELSCVVKVYSNEAACHLEAPLSLIAMHPSIWWVD